MSPKSPTRSGGGAVDFLEETVHLLRLAPPSSLVVYYIGSVPFVVGFLYFWTDMSRSAFAEERHGRAALAIALLFLWMKTWQAVFAGMLHENVTGQADRPWAVSRFFRALRIQAMVQPSALFLLPIAFAVTLPFGWAFAFYQNVTVFSSTADADLTAVCKRASQQAQLWPGQNHALLAILGLFGLFVFLDVGIVLLQIPHLLKALLGIETIFSQSGWGMLNTTFLMATVGITYLCVDPIVKAVYVLRCFHGQAVETGEDLEVMMRGFSGAPVRICVVLMAIALLSGTIKAADVLPSEEDKPRSAATPIVSKEISTEKPSNPRTVPVPELDRAIREVISQREYSWRSPRVKAERVKNPGLLSIFIDSILDTIQSWMKAGLRVARDVVQWIFEVIFKRIVQHHEMTNSGLGWMSSLQILLYALLAAVACALAIIVLRIWKRRTPRTGQIVAQPIVSTPDLADQNVVADQLPEEAWLKLAQELVDRGELRLALRALYLAGLAHLGRREWIRIAKFKSNREYQRELHRRVPAQAGLQSAFSELVSTFDRVWYGLGAVDQTVLAQFREHLERVTAC